MSDFSFSKRTNWSFQNNPLSLKLEEFKQQKVKVADLTQSNSTECGFEYPKQLLSALNNSKNLSYAPLAKGHLSTRNAVVKYYKQKNCIVDPEQLFLTSSTSEGYSFLLKLLTNPGDHVLIPAPSYPLFQFLLELHDVAFDYYPLVYNKGWSIDQEAFQKLVTPKTRAVILVNPNNPTGSFITAKEIAFLNQVCLKNKMALISDEVFLDYPLNPKIHPQSLITNHQVPSFVLSGISKILALPQMKLSWVAVNGPKDYVQGALERLEIISDTYLSVNTPVQNALETWLPESTSIQKQILKRVSENLAFLHQQDLEVLAVDGGWYAIIRDEGIVPEDDFILKLLEEDHILVHPGYFFDFKDEGYLVLSLLTEPKTFRASVEKISFRIKALKVK